MTIYDLSSIFSAFSAVSSESLECYRPHDRIVLTICNLTVSVIFRPPCPGVSEASSLTCGGYVAAWGLGWMLVSSWPRAILVGGGSGR